MLLYTPCTTERISSYPKSLCYIRIIKPLWYLHSQKKLSSLHTKWVEFLEEYTFVLQHRAGVENKPADALSRIHVVLQSMMVHVVGFERLRDEYSTCLEFSIIF